jgi:hypothetical protein
MCIARAGHILSLYRQRAPILTHFEASSPTALTKLTDVNSAKLHTRMPRSKAAKGAHSSVVGARDRDFVEHECASADESDGAVKLQKMLVGVHSCER